MLSQRRKGKAAVKRWVLERRKRRTQAVSAWIGRRRRRRGRCARRAEGIYGGIIRDIQQALYCGLETYLEAIAPRVEVASRLTFWESWSRDFEVPTLASLCE